jgi:hypothetical protein
MLIKEQRKSFEEIIERMRPVRSTIDPTPWLLDNGNGKIIRRLHTITED